MLSSSFGPGLLFRHCLEQYSPGSPFHVGLLHPGVRHKLPSESSSCVSSERLLSGKLEFLHALVQYEPGLLSQLGLSHPGMAHFAHGADKRSESVVGIDIGDTALVGVDDTVLGLNVVVADGGRGVMPSSPRMVLTMG